jgi:hypothetical protein
MRDKYEAAKSAFNAGGTFVGNNADEFNSWFTRSATPTNNSSAPASGFGVQDEVNMQSTQNTTPAYNWP